MTAERAALHPEQARVVERIFLRFLETRSCNGVANELNADGIPAMGGGRWYPLTIRRMLGNETYTGRTYFGKTSIISRRDPLTGKKRREVVEHPPERWIEIPGASPAIVSRDVFDRTQQLLADPIRQRPPKYPDLYLLSGRIRCRHCESAMTGHSHRQRSMLRRYYRCTHYATSNRSFVCHSKELHADAIERLVWQTIGMKLA